MKTPLSHPDWALEYKKPGTELKIINGRYYLYAVKSQYNKETKRSKKISLGILGSITKENGFVASEKKELKEKSKKTYHNKEVFSLEYGFSKWLFDTMENDKILQKLKHNFPTLWQFIVFMVYCRIAYQSPLKNVPFHLEQSDILNLLGWNEKFSDQKISNSLFELGSMQESIHQFMQPKEKQNRTVLMDATDVVLHSKNISLSQKGYNSNMDFQPQFVLLYLYDAVTTEPLYYRILPGNIREISALKNTIKISGMSNCVYIADKGFFSESNLSELEKLNMNYIIPLKRDNKQIPYNSLKDIDLTDNYFEYSKRYIFFTETMIIQNRRINLFLDGKLKEQEKADYLTRIQSLPESFSKTKFNDKVKTMGTITLIHNTEFTPVELYNEYKNRCEIEQFFDHLKNTLDASCSHMQREESLNGWMFINHLSMLMIYKLYDILKKTSLNKKQKLIHKYSIADSVEYLKSIKKIKFNKNESIIAEINKPTKTLLEKMKISIT
jgi:transposase